MSYTRRTTFLPAFNVPFNAADFAGSGGLTWTVAAGDVNGFSYLIMGKRMMLAFDLVTTTVGGVLANNFLTVKIPGGALPAKTVQVPFTYQDNGGVPTAGYCIITMGSNLLNFRPAAGANWSASVDLTRLSFNQAFEIQ
jgi:hypothetical protein